MIKKIKIALAILCSTVGLLFAPALPGLAVSPNPLDQACSQGTANTSAICQQSQGQNANPSNPIAGPGGVINKAANIIALVTGIGAVIMILIGGFFYVTSAGNAENAAKAKARILSALIGLVVVALAWTIVRLITDRVIR